ncbi:hypothetical protein [Luteitalea sp.]
MATGLARLVIAERVQEAVTLTVDRNGRDQQLALRVPERRMAVGLHNVAQPR